MGGTIIPALPLARPPAIVSPPLAAIGLLKARRIAMMRRRAW